MLEWIETLTYCGQDVSFEVQLLEVLPDHRVRMRPVIRAGEVALWTGDEDILGKGGSLSLSGFKLRGDDLVLEGFGEYV